MRPVSFFTILLLCLLILLVDILAFYWLQSITNLIVSSTIRILIHSLFWIFTIGLVTAILILKLRLDAVNPTKRHMYIASFYGLTVSSIIPKFIFVLIISVLYGINFIFTEQESLVVIPLIGLLSGFLPFFIIVSGIFRTLYKFKVYKKIIAFSNLPLSFDGFKIVHISDLHLGSFNYRYRILERAISQINALEPDIICFTGDLVNNFAWELRGWNSVFMKLRATRGKYAILGNHDYGDYSKWDSPNEKQENFIQIKQFYKETGFQLLLNESIILTHMNDQIAIVGVENWGNPPFQQYGDLDKALSGLDENVFKILLTHNPSHWSEKVIGDTAIPLTLAGHTHGMQMGVQYKNVQWSPIKYKYKHWAGLYSKDDQYLYVNRGLGWLGLPARIGMRPEISLIELKCA